MKKEINHGKVGCIKITNNEFNVNFYINYSLNIMHTKKSVVYYRDLEFFYQNF